MKSSLYIYLGVSDKEATGWINPHRSGYLESGVGIRFNRNASAFSAHLSKRDRGKEVRNADLGKVVSFV